jgi:Flp pilus assembly protein TadD
MEEACRNLLKVQPKSFDGLQLLGLALAQQEKNTEAIPVFKRALEIIPHAGVYNNLGIAYQELGQYQEAVDSFQKSIKLDPDKPESLNNVGTALLCMKDYQNAKKAYEHAIKLYPEFRVAFDNLGVCLKKMGLLQESISQHLKAHDLDPSSPLEYVNLFQALLLSHITDDALYVAKKGLEVATTPSPERLELLIGVAIISWLSGQYDLAREALEKSKFSCHGDFSTPESLKNYKFLKPLRSFRFYLLNLLKIRSETPDLYRGETDKPIFFVGESHCLSPSETLVRYKELTYRVLSTFINGCKAWHLAKSDGNEYKKSLEILLKALPPQSKIIVGIGEIDCREDEGILLAFQKKGVDFHSSVPNIVAAYVDYVTLLAKQFSHTLVFYGVPALSERRTLTRAPEQRELLRKIIQLFNMELRLACNRNGWELLDVYSATQTNKTFHIDTHHLHPKTLGILFQSYLVAPDLPATQQYT